MYAHQVIEDLKMLGHKEFIKGQRALSEFFIDKIRKSQQFHFGKMENLPFDEERRDEIWELSRRYWKQPYMTCWFDFLWRGEETGRHYLMAMLCEDDGTETTLNLFFKSMPSGIWLWCGTFFMTRQTIGHYPYLLRVAIPPYFGQEQEDAGKLMCNEYLRLLILLNCKNVEAQRVFPHIKAHNKRVKKGLEGLFEYHVLKISHDLKSSVASAKSGSMNRLHLCRGHFKEYTEEAPLMGKHVGLYFWQPHVRGRNKKGIVIKDYEF